MIGRNSRSERLAEPLLGTRLYRQEIAAEILVDVEGALFPRQLIDKNRVRQHAELKRVVVGVDPSGTATGDRTGIVIAGLGVDGHDYVLADWSLRGSSDEWARRVVQAYHSFKADEVVVETNFGADLAISVLRQADSNGGTSEKPAAVSSNGWPPPGRAFVSRESLGATALTDGFVISTLCTRIR
jgi:phage terminase large subunit-like protein